MPVAVREAVDPNDSERRLMLWSNGRLEPAGLNPPSQPPQDALDDSHSAGNAPISLIDDAFVGLFITSWATDPPSGYTFIRHGIAFNFGSAADPIDDSLQPNFLTAPYEAYVDFWMNPAGDGQGYALGDNGTIPNIGGSPIIDSQFLDFDIARRIYMPDWTTKKYVIVDCVGRVHSRHGAVAISVDGRAPLSIIDLGDFYRAAAFYDDLDAGGGHGWLLMSEGDVHTLNGAQDVFGNPHHPGWPYSTDLIIIDDGLGATPLRLGELGWYGGTEEFTVSTAPQVSTVQSATPADPTTTTTRPTLGETYADLEGDQQNAVEWRVFTDAQYLAGATNEVQRLTVTGAPTGGTGTVTFDGVQSGAINWNSTAAQLQTVLEAMPNIDPGDVAVTGGPWPATPITITFQGKLAAHNWDQMTAADAFTGGSSPTIVPSTITPGVGIDPEVAAPVWSKDWGPLEARQGRSVQVDQDLPNDTYRYYVRVTDTSGLKSKWAYRQWTQNVTVPTAPDLAVTASGPLAPVLLEVTTSDLTPGAVFGVQYRDAASDSWRWVRDGHALLPAGTTPAYASVPDRAAPFNRQRTYRAVQYVPVPLLVGEFSTEEVATLESTQWVLSNPYGGEAMVLPMRGEDDLAWLHKVVSATAWPSGRPGPIVQTDGGPKLGSGTLPLRTLSKSEWDQLWLIVNATRVLLVRDPFGNVWHVVPNGDIPDTLKNAMPLADETTPTSHLHELDIPCQQIDRPASGPETGALALLT